MKQSPFAILLLLCPLAVAQSTFSGPGVLSQGTGGIGKRSGQDVDLKYFVNATGVYDTGITPYAVTGKGTLVQPGGLLGVEAGLGAYGRHAFRRSAIGLDYTGNFRHYSKASNFDGSNQQLGLEYTYQKSRRLLFDFAAGAGTQSFGTSIGNFSGIDLGLDTTALLFDNRTSYIQTAMSTRYALSNRTVLSTVGNYYSVHRQASALVGVNGYALSGSVQHELSRRTVVGVTYQHTHFDFPRAFGESDINTYLVTLARTFGRDWTLSGSAGAFTSAVQGVQSTALDPAIAALLGIGSVRTIFYKESTVPMVSVNLTRNFRRSNLVGSFQRTVSPGNGVFLTSLQESYSGAYSYTGFRRVGFSATGGSARLDSLGQDLQSYQQLFGSVNLSYKLGAGLSFGASYLRRHQDIQSDGFRRDSSRMSISIYFSPGEVPISLH